MKIIDIDSMQILDSRGNPTLQVSIMLKDGSKGEFRVPSGASTGIHEAHELRDGNLNEYQGKSVQVCIDNIEKVKDKILNIELDQFQLDKLLIDIDNTENKEKLGANTILGISIAFAKASAKFNNKPLWRHLQYLADSIGCKYEKTGKVNLFANIINGGLHSGNKLNIQEFMVVPQLGNLKDDIRAVSEIDQELKKIIETKYGKENTNVGDEGGFAPSIKSTKQAFDLLDQAVKNSNYKGKVYYAIDAAASDFMDQKKKKYTVEERKSLDYKELTKFYLELVKDYPLISIEDPFGEDDFKGFAHFMKISEKLKVNNPITKEKLMVVGDDLTVTNTKRISTAINKKLCNTLLLKINQIGTLTESLEAFKMASDNGWHVIISHRSGETTDSFIADFSYAMSSSIKIGAPVRGERIAKYNRLLEIEHKG